jgi:glutathione S-transferase
MTIVMHDLAAADPDLRFSPYCWSIKFARAHKGLPLETIPWRFTEKEAIAFSGQKLVPVIRDGERVVSDSWAIAEYLEDTRPEPALFGSGAARAHALFIRHWADAVMVPGIARCIVRDIWEIADPKDRAYFRETREAWLGSSLEQFHADRDRHAGVFREALTPVRSVLSTQPFLGGASPTYADHIVSGMLMWARCVSRFPLLVENDAVAAWFDRMRDLYGGLGRSAKVV